MLADVEVEFKYVSGGEDITSLLNLPTVTIYQNGSIVYTVAWGEYYDPDTYQYVIGNGSVTLDDALVGTKLAYVSSLGHKAEFTLQANMSAIELNCSKLTVTAKDEEGNALTGSGIFLDGTTKRTVVIDEDGQGVAYVAPGLYTYSWQYGNGTVDLSADNSLSLTAKVEKIEEQKTYTLRVRPRYGNYPVDYNNSYYLYQDGTRLEYLDRSYGSGTRYWYTTVTAGTYEIRDNMDGTSGEFIVESDTTIYIDYHKVVFTSKCGSTANVGQVIGIGKPGDSYDNSIKSTDASGVAEFYLLSGNYRYKVAGSTTEFTVTNEDLSFSIETVKLTFKVQCDNLNAVSFWVNGQDVAVAADGTFSYGCLPGSEVELEVSNGDYFATTKMTVTADASKTIDVKLHALQFNSNYTSANEISVRSSSTYSSFTAEWNRKYYLIEGTYSYQDPVTSAYVALNLTEDKTIDFNFATVTVNVVDTDGKTVTDTYVRLGSGSSQSTDKSGNVVFHCVPGNYTLSWGNRYYSDALVSEEITVESDMQTTLTIPAFVSFNIVGLENSERDVYTVDNLYVGSVKEGENSLRLDPNGEYTISGYHGKTKITNGCTITLGTLSVTSQGNGLAFPMENWDAVSTYRMIVGSLVRLSAIPVGNDKFQKWTVNGKDYADAMIDFKTTSQNTEATAVFSGSSTAVSRPMQTNSSLDFNESYIILPNEMEGSARIYTLDGKLVKQIGVVGDQIGIYDLPAGAYVLSFQHEEGAINARFVKK